MTQSQPVSVTPSAAPVAEWHRISATAALDVLEASRDGLPEGEAARRRGIWGANEILVAGPTPWWQTLARQFVSPLILILVVATIVTALLQEWIDTTAIFLVLMLNAGIGFWQEKRAESAVLALRELSAPTCRVVRDGRPEQSDARMLVPGDIVALESGERIPADLRLIQESDLRVDESLFTGEVLPVSKTTDAYRALIDELIDVDDDDSLDGAEASEQRQLALSGTLVTSGRARGLVVATGAQTQLGEISDLVQSTETRSPLQLLTHGLERKIGAVVAIGSSSIFVVGVLLGNSASEMFRTAVALAVASVPESLPIVLTVAMSLGVARMARHNAIVRSLPAVETLGSTTLIGSDKTGTLTLNRLTIEVVWCAAGLVDRRAGPSRESGRDALLDGAEPATRAGALAVLRSGALTNEAVARPEDPRTFTGDAVDVAYLVAAIDAMAVQEDEWAAPPLADMPYEPELRLSQSVRREADGRRFLHVKGSPDVLADVCDRMATPHGESPIDLDLVERINHELAASGLRVIASAIRELGPDEPVAEPLRWPAGLTFLGMAGLEDPPREGVVDAVAQCRRAGLRVTMITGDHPSTAAAIADRLGLDTTHPPLTGHEMSSLDDAALSARLAATDVAARVTPVDKLRIARLHEDRGEVIAVTGDGVNDAPALKAASIGVAMGKSGTDVAREAADIVLTDDNFVTIVEAIRQGRVTFAAIRNATFFLLATGLASLLAVSTNVVVGGPLLFLPIQLLFINVVTNGLQDIALAFEPPAGNELSRPPRPRSEGILSRALWQRLLVIGLWIAGSILVAFQWALAQGYELEHARTLAITLFVWMNFSLVGTARSEHRSIFAMNPWSNRPLIASAVGALLLHWGATTWEPAASVLGFVPLSSTEWLACAVLGTSALAISELDKLRQWRSQHA